VDARDRHAGNLGLAILYAVTLASAAVLPLVFVALMWLAGPGTLIALVTPPLGWDVLLWGLGVLIFAVFAFTMFGVSAVFLVHARTVLRTRPPLRVGLRQLATAYSRALNTVGEDYESMRR
jgi:hypothetical protein